MTVRVTEKPKQAGTIQFRAPKGRREYTVSGTLSKLDAQIAVASTCPGADSGIDADGSTIAIFLNKIDIQEIGGGVWHATCDYSNTPDQFSIAFNIGTQSIKRQQALEHIATYDCKLGGIVDPDDDSSGIPDFMGAIGVHGGDNGAAFSAVDGVNVEVSKVEFTLTKKWAYAILPSAYTLTIMQLTPCVNAAEFVFYFKGQSFNFPKGSVLFRGAPMTTNSDDQVEISYQFAYSKNVGLSHTTWDAGTTYGVLATVEYGGHVWESQIDPNLNILPPPPDRWINLVTYNLGDKVQWETNIYTSLANGNVQNKPSEEPLQWQDDGLLPWKDLGPVRPELSVANSGPIVAEGW